jgi:hypothetical protein
MRERIRTLLLEANGTHWAAVCLDTIGQGIFTADCSTPLWIARSPRLRKLFGDRYGDASYMSDWREAFSASDRLAVSVCNITNLVEFWRSRRDIRDFDLIVILHSAAGDRMSILAHTAGWFQDRRGKLAMFIGNEYDLMSEKISFARQAGVDYICTQLPIATARALYHSCSSAVVAMPHALNPHIYRDRPGVPRIVDVGFVGDLYERLIGDRERTDIVEFFARRGSDFGLRCEIRKQRMPRDAWAEFLLSCHSVIGAESGTYFLQADGQALNCAKARVRKDPRASFESVYQDCFSRTGPVLNGKAISSRHFEPIGTKTCQVLIEGSFNGILKPDVHYIAVKKDLSNIEDAIQRLKHPAHREAIADAAYEHVVSGHTYDHRVAHLVDVAFGAAAAA